MDPPGPAEAIFSHANRWAAWWLEKLVGDMGAKGVRRGLPGLKKGVPGEQFWKHFRV